MSCDLRDRCALITGGGSGIGAALALHLARAGMRVAVVGRRLALCEAVTAEIAAAGGSALPLACDVADPAQAEDAVARTVAAFGSLDLLVNNAGVHSGKRLLETSDADWKAIVGTSLDGAFACTRAAFRRMREQGRGQIITIASQAAGWAGPWEFAYGIAKAAQVRLTLHLLAEMERTRHERAQADLDPGSFAAQVLCPGPVATAINQAKLAAGGRPQPALTTDEVAEVVAALAHEPDLGRSALAERFAGRFQVGPVGLFEPHEAIIRLWRD